MGCGSEAVRRSGQHGLVNLSIVQGSVDEILVGGLLLWRRLLVHERSLLLLLLERDSSSLLARYKLNILLVRHIVLLTLERPVSILTHLRVKGRRLAHLPLN